MFEFEFTGTVVRSQGTASWHFIYLPEEMSHDVKRWCGDLKGGWGSIKVEATIGSTTWKTSIFPSKQLDTYLLPLKAPVRKAEGVGDGDEVVVVLIM